MLVECESLKTIVFYRVSEFENPKRKILNQVLNPLNRSYTMNSVPVYFNFDYEFIENWLKIVPILASEYFSNSSVLLRFAKLNSNFFLFKLNEFKFNLFLINGPIFIPVYCVFSFSHLNMIRSQAGFASNLIKYSQNGY